MSVGKLLFVFYYSWPQSHADVPNDGDYLRFCVTHDLEAKVSIRKIQNGKKTYFLAPMKEFIWKITDSEMIGRNGGELGQVETDNKEVKRN